MGGPARRASPPGTSRPNLVRSHFTGTSLGDSEKRIISRSSGIDALEASLVADIRRVHGRYPGDRGVRVLVEELLASSERFRQLWDSGAVGEHQSERKVVRSDVVGDVELDCDVFSVAGSDLRIVAYTAPSGSEAPRSSTSCASQPSLRSCPGADDCLPRDVRDGRRAPCSEHWASLRVVRARRVSIAV